jgi:hypothetical protein
MLRTVLTVPLLLMAALAVAQEHHDRAPDDPFTLKPLSGNVYALYDRGGNVGFYVGPDAVVVVDSQFKDLAPGIVAKIKSVTDKPIKIDVAHGGSVKGYLVALDQVIGRVPASVTIIPGHGEVSDVAGLKAFRQYIADVLDAARKAKAAGTSKDDFLKQVDIAAYKDYSGYADRFKSNAAAAWDEVH